MFIDFQQILDKSAWILHLRPDFTNALHFLPVLLDKHHDGERQNHLRDMVNSQKKTAEKIMMTQIRSQAYYCT